MLQRLPAVALVLMLLAGLQVEQDPPHVTTDLPDLTLNDPESYTLQQRLPADAHRLDLLPELAGLELPPIQAQTFLTTCLQTHNPVVRCRGCRQMPRC